MDKLTLNGKKIVLVGSTGVGKTTIRKILSLNCGMSDYSTDVYPYDNKLEGLKYIISECEAFNLIEIGSNYLSDFTTEQFKELKEILKEHAYVIYLKPTADDAYNLEFLKKVVQYRDNCDYHSVLNRNTEDKPLGGFYKEVADIQYYTLQKKPQKSDIDMADNNFGYFNQIRKNTAVELINMLYAKFNSFTF